jgi:hypothetical protein
MCLGRRDGIPPTGVSRLQLRLLPYGRAAGFFVLCFSMILITPLLHAISSPIFLPQKGPF